MLFAPSQFPRASSISTRHCRHSVGISLPSASIACKHRSSAMRAIPHSLRCRAPIRLRVCASSSSARACICIAGALSGSAASTARSVESAAAVCARASWHRASRKSVLGGAVPSVDAAACSVDASWQSASAERKRLTAMEAAARFVR